MLEDKHDIAVAFAHRLRELHEQLQGSTPAHPRSIHQEITLLTRRIRDLGYSYDTRTGHLTDRARYDPYDIELHETDAASLDPRYDDLLFA